jgi:hypothetical protein
VRRVVACVLAVVGLVGPAGCDRQRAAPAPTRTPTPTAVTTTTVGPGPTPTESVVTGSVTPTATGTPLRLTDDQAATLLLAPTDLPSPYQVDPYVSPDGRVGVPPGCPVLDAFGAVLTSAPVRAARGFLGGQVGPFLEERIAVLPGSAADVVAQFARVAVACRTFDSRDSDGTTVRFAVTPLPLPTTADQAVAVTLVGHQAQSGALVTEAAAVRRGDVVVVFVHSGLDKLDPEVLQAALGRAVRTLNDF